MFNCNYIPIVVAIVKLAALCDHVNRKGINLIRMSRKP